MLGLLKLRKMHLILLMMIVLSCNGCSTSSIGSFCQIYNPVRFTESEYSVTPKSVIYKVMYNNSLYKDLCHAQLQ